MMGAAAAFPSVARGCLLRKMKNTGIDENLVDWADSFMRDRRVIMSVDGRDVDPQSATTGLPQGLPISPEPEALEGKGRESDPSGRPAGPLCKGSDEMAGAVARFGTWPGADGNAPGRPGPRSAASPADTEFPRVYADGEVDPKTMGSLR